MLHMIKANIPGAISVIIAKPGHDRQRIGEPSNPQVNLFIYRRPTLLSFLVLGDIALRATICGGVDIAPVSHTGPGTETRCDGGIYSADIEIEVDASDSRKKEFSTAKVWEISSNDSIIGWIAEASPSNYPGGVKVVRTRPCVVRGVVGLRFPPNAAKKKFGIDASPPVIDSVAAVAPAKGS